MADAGNIGPEPSQEVALFPQYYCRQSLTHFSAPAGENFDLRNSKSACLKKYEIHKQYPSSGAKIFSDMSADIICSE